jgi:amino acid transporter
MFTTMTLLATLSALIPLLACALAELVLQRRDPGGPSRVGTVLSLLALIYGAAAIVGSGVETVVWGLALLLGGLPVYLWMRRGEGPLRGQPRPE